MKGREETGLESLCALEVGKQGWEGRTLRTGGFETLTSFVAMCGTVIPRRPVSKSWEARVVWKKWARNSFSGLDIVIIVTTASVKTVFTEICCFACEGLIPCLAFRPFSCLPGG